MEDSTLQNIVSELVNQLNGESLEEAEKLIVNYLDKHPQDVDAWVRLAILQTLPPFGDYQKAVLLLEEAIEHHGSISSLTILLSFSSEWFLGGMNDKQLENLVKTEKNSSDPNTKAILCI